jgi:uncharacterized membrane protein
MGSVRALNYALLAAYWAACVVVYPKLPDRIAIHFNVRGQPDRWSDNLFLAWFGLPAIATITVLLMIGVAKLAKRSPQLWNIPEKRRFLAMTAEQRAPIEEAMLRYLDLAAFYTLGVCTVVQLDIYRNALAIAGGLSWLFHLVLWGGMAVLLAGGIMLNSRIKKMILAADMESSIGRTS